MGLQQARERAASELGLPLSDWRVERLAKLVIADEAMQSLLVVAPERVDFGKMLDIDRALADLRKELGVTKPMELKVSFVDGVVGMFKCQHCHKENRVEDYRAFMRCLKGQRMSDVLHQNDDLTRRINLYRRAYARGLGCRPTALQSVAIRRAATLQVQSEVVLADPTATVNDRVRITGAARRALLDMQAALASKPEHHALTLGELLRDGA
jgi:hypothetical protein